MIFSKNTKLKEVKEKDPEAYGKLLEEATEVVAENNDPKVSSLEKENSSLERENYELKDKLNRKEINDNISSYGDKLGVSEIADQCVKDEKSFDKSLKLMIDEHLKDESNVEKSFDKTASAQAGTGSTDNEEEEGPKDFSSAMSFIKTRDKCTATEAKEKAEKEFPGLKGVYPESND